MSKRWQTIGSGTRTNRLSQILLARSISKCLRNGWISTPRVPDMVAELVRKQHSFGGQAENGELCFECAGASGSRVEPVRRVHSPNFLQKVFDLQVLVISRMSRIGKGLFKTPVPKFLRRVCLVEFANPREGNVLRRVAWDVAGNAKL